MHTYISLFSPTPQEFSELLMDAWNKDQEEKVIREKEKREKRILDNWKRLTKGLMVAMKVKRKYAQQ